MAAGVATILIDSSRKPHQRAREASYSPGMGVCTTRIPAQSATRIRRRIGSAGWLLVSLALVGCGGSDSAATSSGPVATQTAAPSPAAQAPSPSPTVALEPADIEYQRFAGTVAGSMFDPSVSRLCQPITPDLAQRCRAKLVANVAADQAALKSLDEATVPPRFKALNGELRAGVARDLEILNLGVNAIDSGVGTQEALDALPRSYVNNIGQVMAKIRK